MRDAQLVANEDGSTLLVWATRDGLKSIIHSAGSWSKRQYISTNKYVSTPAAISKGAGSYNVIWAVNDSENGLSGLMSSSYSDGKWSGVKPIASEDFSSSCPYYLEPKMVVGSEKNVIASWLHHSCIGNGAWMTSLRYASLQTQGWTKPADVLDLNTFEGVLNYSLEGKEQGFSDAAVIASIIRVRNDGTGIVNSTELMIIKQAISGWGAYESIKLNSGPGDIFFYQPHYTENARGDLGVVWQECQSSPCEIMAKTRVNNSWNGPVKLGTAHSSSSQSGGRDGNPSIQGNGNIGFIATWNNPSYVMSNIYGPESRKQLSVTKNGPGTVTSIPAGISCGATCSESFATGSNVSLIAQPEYGFAFAGWSGACSETGTCAITMDGDKSVSANFIELTKYPVKVTKPSTGLISSEPTGILCGGPNKQCLSSFSSAKLTATPNAGYEFIKWNGCQAPEGNVCLIKPTGNMTVSALFKKLPKYNLKITKNTLGSVISKSAGLNCQDKKKSCTVKFTKGTEVTLNAVPQQGRSFAGWTGACLGTDVCSLLMDDNKGVGATFQ